MKHPPFRLEGFPFFLGIAILAAAFALPPTTAEARLVPQNATWEMNSKVIDGNVTVMLPTGEFRTLSIEQLKKTYSPWRFQLAVDLDTFLGALKSSPPTVFDLVPYQTPLRNQGQRDTCATFAQVAAAEALYNRRFQLDLDLSEQYILNRYGMLQHETTPPTFADKVWAGNLRGYHLPEEKDAPYIALFDMFKLGASLLGTTYQEVQETQDDYANVYTQEQIDLVEFADANVPTEARFKAKYGVGKMLQLPAAVMNDPAMVERVLFSGYEIDAGFNVGHWACTTGKAPEYPDNQEKTFMVTQCGWTDDLMRPDSGHAVLIVGYNRSNPLKPYFILKNSWEEYTRLSYDTYLKSHDGGGFVLLTVRDPRFGPDQRDLWIGKWGMATDGARDRLTLRRTELPCTIGTNGNVLPCKLDNAIAAPVTRLGNLYAQDGTTNKRDIIGWMESPPREMKFFVWDGVVNPSGIIMGIPAFASRSEMIKDPLFQDIERNLSYRLAVYSSGRYAAGYAIDRSSGTAVKKGVFLARDDLETFIGPTSLPGPGSTSLLGEWTITIDDRITGELTIPRMLTDLSQQDAPSQATAKFEGKPYPATWRVIGGSPHEIVVQIPSYPGGKLSLNLLQHRFASKPLLSGLATHNGQILGVHAVRKALIPFSALQQ